MPSSEPGARWQELTAAQLVRYEALFGLLDDVRGLDDIGAIAAQVATRWKYFANVASWRLTVPKGPTYLLVDGHRGGATVREVPRLPAWDAALWRDGRPRLFRSGDPVEAPVPEHLAGRGVHEIQVQPFSRGDGLTGLLSVAARDTGFTELDSKFIKLFGGHFTDSVRGIVLRAQATEALVDRATRDALTGLLNRGTAIERLTGQLAVARRTGRPLGVILGDIDYFKVINDTWGHLAGDKVLHEVSRRLHMQMRSGDVLGRYGGEEFLFVLYPCDVDELTEAAERLRRAVDATPVEVDDNPAGRLEVTISLGAFSTADAPELGVQGLLKHADDALYQSKAEGRNRVTVSNPRDGRRRGLSAT